MKKAHSSWNLEKLGTDNFRVIEAATVKRFPMLKLYNGWGIYAQNLEGSILREVMLKGVEKGIAVLPVHDAVAVQQSDEGWALDAMSEAWDKHVGFGRARLTVDSP